MLLSTAKTRVICSMLFIGLASSCARPPYNNFKSTHDKAVETAGGIGVGTYFGLLAGGTLTGTVVGAAIGGTAGAAHGLYTNNKPSLIRKLSKQKIQYVEYGDTMTLIVPTDQYFMFMSPRLNQLAYPGLNNIIKLLKMYPKTPIYVAGFTDNVGSKAHKNRLSQAQAETMMSYLWANGIKSMRLNTAGYGDKNAVGDNQLAHGSAYNRRIEIQWFKSLVAQADKAPLDMK